MSRIYEVLQQGGQADDLGRQESVNAILAKEFGNTSWDLASAVSVEPVLSSQHHRFRVLTAANSFIAEQFRTLQTRLQHIREQRTLKTLLVTSGLGEEGKSFVALNLASSLSQHGKRKVLLFEGDLRRPALCTQLSLGPLAGFSDWSRTSERISKFIYRLSSFDIFFLPAGTELTQPVDTLGSQRTLDLLNETSRVFDWVVVDSAPLVPLADTSVLSRICDGTLIVVRRGRAMKSSLVQALESVESSKLVGFVLNDFPGCDYDYRKYHSSREQRQHDSRASTKSNSA